MHYDEWETEFYRLSRSIADHMETLTAHLKNKPSRDAKPEPALRFVARKLHYADVAPWYVMDMDWNRCVSRYCDTEHEAQLIAARMNGSAS